VFLNSKKLLAKKTTTGVRYYKKIGLGKFSFFILSISKAFIFERASQIYGRDLKY
jgi:hypothetical protein